MLEVKGLKKTFKMSKKAAENRKDKRKNQSGGSRRFI